MSQQPNRDKLLREKSVRIGQMAARKIFESRGDHSEAHISEEELAVVCATMFEHGIECAEIFERQCRKIDDAVLARYGVKPP